MAQSSPDTNIEAQVGNVSGGSQVAVGSYILQIGSLEGGVVNFAQEKPAAPRPRPQPVLLRPRAFPGILDRETETDNALQALQSQESVECSGAPGSGKTSLLRHLAYHPQTEIFQSGIIYFQVNRQSNADLLKSLFDAFYEYDSPAKPTEMQIRHALQNVRALILLDDVEITREQLEYLMNIAPGCTFITASTERRLYGETREVTLKGLPAGEAVTLFQREFGRALSEDEQRGAQTVCESLDCYPQRILHAARQAREENRSLVELAGPAQSGSALPPAQSLTAEVVKPRSEDERKVLAALAVFYGAPVHTEHVAATAGLASAAETLDILERRGLVQSHEERYSLTSDVNDALRREQTLTPERERALAHFIRWAEENRTESKLIAEEAQPILLILEWGVAAELWTEVKRLGHAVEEALASSGKWDMWDAALQVILKAAQAKKDRANEAWALHQLGTRALCLGERSAAAASLNEALRMRESLNDTSGAAVTRHNLRILLSPPAPDRPDSNPAPPISKLPLLLKLLIPALLLLLGGAIAWRYWPSKKPAVIRASIVAFSISPPTVQANTPVQLCYEVLNASSVRIEPDIGERKPATKECLPVTPQQTTTYLLTATGFDGQTISQQVIVTVEAPPALPSAEILRFEILRQQGASGANDNQFQLCYGVRNANHVEIDNGIGEVELAEQRCLPIKPERTTTYTLTVVGSDGQTVNQQVTVDVNKPPPPPAQILSFDPSPASVVAGETAQLCYQLKDASSARIDGVGNVSAGADRQCVKVAPKETAAYTLTAINPEGKAVNKKVSVFVTRPPAKIVRFTADPNSVVIEGGIRLCYEIAHASRAEIDNGIGEVRPTNGCKNTSVSRDSKTFTLTATGPDGQTDKQSVTVKVTHPPAQISIRATPETIRPGETAQLCYQVSNVRNFGIDQGIDQADRVSFNDAGELCARVSPQKTTTYTLTATTFDGQKLSRQATVNVIEPSRKHARIIYFNASERRVKEGQAVRLCYGVADTERASLAPIRKSVPLGREECIEDFPKKSTTYTLTATGEDEQPEVRSVSIEVVSDEPPPAPVKITRFGLNSTLLGEIQLCYAFENARSANISPDFGEVAQRPRACLTIKSREPRTYTLTATGFDGSSEQRSVEYTPRKPVPISIIKFWTTTPTIPPGAQAQICYSTIGEGTAKILPQPGAVTPSLRNCVKVATKETTVYTLTVTGPEGQQDWKEVAVSVQRQGPYNQ